MNTIQQRSHQLALLLRRRKKEVISDNFETVSDDPSIASSSSSNSINRSNRAKSDNVRFSEAAVTRDETNDKEEEDSRSHTDIQAKDGDNFGRPRILAAPSMKTLLTENIPENAGEEVVATSTPTRNKRRKSRSSPKKARNNEEGTSITSPHLQSSSNRIIHHNNKPSTPSSMTRLVTPVSPSIPSLFQKSPVPEGNALSQSEPIISTYEHIDDIPVPTTPKVSKRTRHSSKNQNNKEVLVGGTGVDSPASVGKLNARGKTRSKREQSTILHRSGTPRTPVKKRFNDDVKIVQMMGQMASPLLKEITSETHQQVRSPRSNNTINAETPMILPTKSNTTNDKDDNNSPEETVASPSSPTKRGRRRGVLLSPKSKDSPIPSFRDSSVERVKIILKGYLAGKDTSEEKSPNSIIEQLSCDHYFSHKKNHREPMSSSYTIAKDSSSKDDIELTQSPAKFQYKRRKSRVELLKHEMQEDILARRKLHLPHLMEEKSRDESKSKSQIATASRSQSRVSGRRDRGGGISSSSSVAREYCISKSRSKSRTSGSSRRPSGSRSVATFDSNPNRSSSLPPTREGLLSKEKYSGEKTALMKHLEFVAGDEHLKRLSMKKSSKKRRARVRATSGAASVTATECNLSTMLSRSGVRRSRRASGSRSVATHDVQSTRLSSIERRGIVPRTRSADGKILISASPKKTPALSPDITSIAKDTTATPRRKRPPQKKAAGDSHSTKCNLRTPTNKKKNIGGSYAECIPLPPLLSSENSPKTLFSKRSPKKRHDNRQPFRPEKSSLDKNQNLNESPQNNDKSLKVPEGLVDEKYVFDDEDPISIQPVKGRKVNKRLGYDSVSVIVPQLQLPGIDISSHRAMGVHYDDVASVMINCDNN